MYGLADKLAAAAIFDATGSGSIQTIAGYAAVLIVFGFGLVVLVLMILNKIKLDTLIGEDGGGASMSRFQLLIFTFVVALSLFIIVANNPTGFPQIPSGVLTLVGLSATTYGVSKGIQATGGLKGKDTGNDTGKDHTQKEEKK
jgi:uncharacterized BrkB/YihY/UPF0761 family membrane protein